MVENELEFLFAGFAVFWAGLFVYLIILQGRLRDLQREIDQLEERLEEAGSASPASTAAPSPGTGDATEDEHGAAADGDTPDEAGTGA